MAVSFKKLEKKQITNLKQQKQHLYRYWKDSRMINDDSVLKAFLAVPRELFVDPSYLDQSYADHPLPIGSGQTISQPTTGSGYNAALLAELAEMVVTVERHVELAELACENLCRAGLEEVVVIKGDGKQGYSKLAPYDRIIVTAAANRVPKNLKDQLAVGGLLVAPVGATHGCEMLLMRKTAQGHFQTSGHGLFSFVPLI